ncbi:MAG: AAA family ATPase [Crenarchaeota archaeon]|nr:AAA family ATPase [Thermoproteota archaeon]
MCVRIGILYIKGSMPLYENFGNLPNYIVRKCDDIYRCDMLIVPPGYIVETCLFSEFSKHIISYYEKGGLIVGVCSGFQLLSRSVMTRIRTIDCLGILDVTFSPLICTDVTYIDILQDIWMFKGVRKIRAFHAHTFAPSFTGRVKIVGVSRPDRVNYFERGRPIIAIVSDKEERCIGILPHSVLDNTEIVKNICEKLGIKDIDKHREANRELVREIRSELGVCTGMHVREREHPCKIVLCVTSTMTSDGKTFITTGLSSVLRMRGLRVYVLKLGGDVRDVHPSLYMIKEPVKEYTTIKIRGRSRTYGWSDPDIAIRKALSEHDVIIVEGVMGILTGESYRRDDTDDIFSTLHFLERYHVPHILVLSPTMGGIEDAYVRLRAYLEYLNTHDALPVAVILNRCYDVESPYLEKMYEICMKYGVSFYVVPEDRRLPRESHPEIDLDVDRYSMCALELVNKYVDIDDILNKCVRYLKRFDSVTMEGKLKNEESIRSKE